LILDQYVSHTPLDEFKNFATCPARIGDILNVTKTKFKKKKSNFE